MLGIFEEVVHQWAKAIPDLGKTLTLDSKAILLYGKPVQDPKKRSRRHGRWEMDADHGMKEYPGFREEGRAWRKMVK